MHGSSIFVLLFESDNPWILIAWIANLNSATLFGNLSHQFCIGPSFLETFSPNILSFSTLPTLWFHLVCPFYKSRAWESLTWFTHYEWSSAHQELTRSSEWYSPMSRKEHRNPSLFCTSWLCASSTSRILKQKVQMWFL